MSRVLKVIDNETIEISEYKCPEVIFKYSNNIPPTLEDTRKEIQHIEDYCVFKRTINPFQMYAENERLNAILNNIHNYIEKMSYCEVVDNPKKELSRILEKGE